MTVSCAMSGSISKMSLYQSQNGSTNISVPSRLYRHRTHHWDYTGTSNIYHDEHPPSEMSTLIRNAKEMFWHWHVTYVWTLWPGEERRDGEGAGPGQDCDEWVSSGWRRDQAQAPSWTRKKLEWSNECYFHINIVSKRNAYAFQF